MNSTFTKNEKDSAIISFLEIINACWEVDPDPIKEIRVGKSFYKKLFTDFEMSFPAPEKKPKKVLFLSSLYGVKILIDPELKPNQYKVVRNKTNI
jgi:hypothetical protein